MFLLLFIYPTGILASDNNIETKIWLLEGDYVAGFRDAADDKVIPMWHEHFLGWPASEARPADKQAVVEYLRKHAPCPGPGPFK